MCSPLLPSYRRCLIHLFLSSSKSIFLLVRSLATQITKGLEDKAVKPVLNRIRTLVRTVMNSTSLSHSVCLTQAQMESLTFMDELAALSDSEPASDPHLPAWTSIAKAGIRWKYTLLMIGPALSQARSSLDCLLLHSKKPKHRALALSESEWRLLEEITSILAPFQQLLRMLEGDYDFETGRWTGVPFSLVWPAVTSLRRFLRGRQPLDVDPPVGLPVWSEWSAAANSLRLALLREVSREDRFQKPDKMTVVATLLDPR